MKIARFLWLIASFYLLIVGLIYIFILGDAPETYPEREDYIREHWGWYELQWKGEFLIAVFLAVSSFIFANLMGRMEFYLIAVGQLVIAMGFPPSLAFGELETFQNYQQVGKIGHLYVNFGFLISLAGFILLHWQNDTLNSWLHKLAFLLALIAGLAFGAAFLGMISQSEAQMSMILVMLLYLINGMYGFKLKSA
jgi:hypothetical protein